MSRFHLIWLLCCATLLLTGCGPGTAAVGPLPALSLIGMGIGLGDLLRPDGAARLYAYLKEIIAAGYAKEIRFDLGRVWGPQLLTSAYPTIREQGFKVLAILSPGQQDPVGEVKLDEDIAWLRVALPQVRDLLIGVQLCNEPWNPDMGQPLPVFEPTAYIAWHNALAKVVRELLPGVPLLAGDVGGSSSRGWWGAVDGKIDYDVVSSHLYGLDDLYGPTSKPVWVTEAGQLSYWRPWHQKFMLYVWASTDQWAKRPGGGILP